MAQTARHDNESPATGRRDYYLTFTADHDAAQAIRSYLARFGAYPTNIKWSRKRHHLSLGPAPLLTSGATTTNVFTCEPANVGPYQLALAL